MYDINQEQGLFIIVFKIKNILCLKISLENKQCADVYVFTLYKDNYFYWTKKKYEKKSFLIYTRKMRKIIN